MAPNRLRILVPSLVRGVYMLVLILSNITKNVLKMTNSAFPD